MATRILNVRQLQDGTGRVCMHWFVRDPKGPIHNQGRIVQTAMGPFEFAASRGRISCNPEQNTVLPQERATSAGTEISMCMRSDEVRAVTCPDCMATEEFKQALQELETVLSKASG